MHFRQRFFANSWKLLRRKVKKSKPLAEKICKGLFVCQTPANSPLFVKGRIVGVKILRVKLILCQAQCISESLIVHDFTRAQKL